MKHIEIKVLNPTSVADAKTMMGACARLTQRAEKIACLADFMKMYKKEISDDFEAALTKLPHPTLQKMGVINVVVIGASRRFLAQITRHQNEVKFMSGSLQYSNYGDDHDFAIPYNILKAGDEQIKKYLEVSADAMKAYKQFNEVVDNDSCGYLAPQGLRNVLIISATPYQWKHMISQRVCRRNTDETRIVMTKIWQALYDLDPIMFSPETTGPFCVIGRCKEGKMSCGKRMFVVQPDEIIERDYPLLMEV